MTLLFGLITVLEHRTNTLETSMHFTWALLSTGQKKKIRFLSMLLYVLQQFSSFIFGIISKLGHFYYDIVLVFPSWY